MFNGSNMYAGEYTVKRLRERKNLYVRRIRQYILFIGRKVTLSRQADSRCIFIKNMTADCKDYEYQIQ